MAADLKRYQDAVDKYLAGSKDYGEACWDIQTVMPIVAELRGATLREFVAGLGMQLPAKTATRMVPSDIAVLVKLRAFLIATRTKQDGGEAAG